MVASTQVDNWIQFNSPYLTGNELKYVGQAHMLGQLAGDGAFTKRCEAWIEQLGTSKALLTHSCTAALEMAAILCNISEGDEVIMPSYTFVSTANAFVLRGATPVFVDIKPDTLNIDEKLIEEAITNKTKAIVVVHYAGVACEMDSIMEIARRHDLLVIEDAAQACLSSYKGRALGTIGDLGCFSFHETKNIISGEGGAILINRPEFIARAEIIREKGTNRSKFFRGEVDKYTWTDIGSSFLPGEIIAAFLWAQMEAGRDITDRRIQLWNHYNQELSIYPNVIKTPTIPAACQHNAHMFYIILNNNFDRDYIIQSLKLKGIHTVFHYVPLHSSIFGLQKGITSSNSLPVTNFISNKIIRLPLWIGLDLDKQNYIISSLQDELKLSNSNLNNSSIFSTYTKYDARTSKNSSLPQKI